MRLQNLLLFFLVNLVGLIFVYSPGTPDVAMRLGFIEKMDALGVRSGLEASYQDYPPLGLVILNMATKVSKLLGADAIMGFQLAVALFLVLTSVVLLIWTRSLFFVSMTQLTVTINSLALGYIDIFFVPPLLVSLWALKERRFFVFTIAFSVSCLIKWQPAIIAPFLLVYILNIDSVEAWRNSIVTSSLNQWSCLSWEWLQSL